MPGGTWNQETHSSLLIVVHGLWTVGKCILARKPAPVRVYGRSLIEEVSCGLRRIQNDDMLASDAKVHNVGICERGQSLSARSSHVRADGALYSRLQSAY